MIEILSYSVIQRYFRLDLDEDLTIDKGGRMKSMWRLYSIYGSFVDERQKFIYNPKNFYISKSLSIKLPQSLNKIQKKKIEKLKVEIDETLSKRSKHWEQFSDMKSIIYQTIRKEKKKDMFRKKGFTVKCEIFS